MSINNLKTEIKESIIEIIKNVKYEPVTYDEMKRMLLLEDTEENNSNFDEVINELVNEYKLFINKKGYLLNDRKANKFIGTISIRNNDYGFVTNDYCDDFYVDGFDFNEAMDKDIVLYSTSKYQMGNKYYYNAKVLKIIKRRFEYLVGEIIYEHGRTYLSCNEKGLNKKCIVSKINKGKVGDIVRAKIISYDYCLKVEVIEILGNSKELGMDITSVVAKMNIPYVFPEEVIKAANCLEDGADKSKYEVFDKDLIFTIDGLDAKDLDDAVSISKNDNGNYNVGVYIADVSYYVKEGSEIDIEALNRGTSIYLVDRVIPMLPVKLSNDLCSLNPNQEKLVMALFMEVNNKGEVVDAIVKEGIIKTTKRLSYEGCNKLFETGSVDNKQISDDLVGKECGGVEYSSLDLALDSLGLMRELSQILQEKRDKRGSINFDVDEAKVIVDEKGKAIDIVLRERGISEKIIEEFMILANETVAEMIYQMDLPFIYRIHEEPDLVKFHLLKELVSSLGYSVKSLHPKELQKLLAKIDETKEHSYIKNSILRLMNKAIYSDENDGHFGLASRWYTHFTSPIRRYPDLLVHRLLRKYLINNNTELDSNKYNKLKEIISDIAKKCSNREKVAIECEYKVLDMKKAEYMEKYIGEEFEGAVSSIHRFGIFVTLPNTVDGLLSSRGLSKHDYTYNLETNCYFNYKTGKKLSLGTNVKVVLTKVNKKLGEIDFDLVYNKVRNKDRVKNRYRVTNIERNRNTNRNTNNTNIEREKRKNGKKRKHKSNR